MVGDVPWTNRLKSRKPSVQSGFAMSISALLLLILTVFQVDADVPWIATKPQRKVCVVNYMPITSCEGSTSKEAGYENEMFKAAVELLTRNNNMPEWGPGNWTFMCWESWDNLMRDLLRPAGSRTCDVGVAGISMTPQRISQGYKFSYPVYPSGQRILVHVDRSRSIWSFLEPFEPRLWLVLFATSVVAAFLILLAEVPLRRVVSSRRALWAKYSNLQWSSTSTLVRGVQQLSPRTPAGRLILLAYGFLALIAVNSYISAYAAIFNAQPLARTVDSITDLADKPVGVFKDDVLLFKRFALQDVVALPWSTQEDEERMLALLRDGRISALVLDAPWVEYTAATNCDLFVMGETVLPTNLAFAFPPDTPEEYIQYFDYVLGVLDTNGDMVQLQRKYVRPLTRCHSSDWQQEFGKPQVTLHEMSGLWIMFACAVAVGYIWNGSVWVLSAVRSRHMDKSHQGISKALSASSKGLGSPSSAYDNWMNISEATTTDEAIQMLDARLRQVDNHIKHIPFVIAATMESKLADLKSELMAAAKRPASNPTTAMRDGIPMRLEDHFPQLANRQGLLHNWPIGMGSSGPAFGETSTSGHSVMPTAQGPCEVHPSMP